MKVLSIRGTKEDMQKRIDSEGLEADEIEEFEVEIEGEKVKFTRAHVIN